jgi:oligopeptide transport system ATP-binding protein
MTISQTNLTSIQPLLEVSHLSTQFNTDEGVVHAVTDLSYRLEEGEILGVVGESGCGKSVHALSIMRLIAMPPGKIVAGEVLFQGQNLLKISEPEMRKVRGGQIAMIFQDPMTSLNPVLTIGFQISEALVQHENLGPKEARERVAELLDLVGIPEARQRLDDYPHQYSGGMRQRAMIAMARSCNPKILIADEPTTALDVTIQAQILDLVRRLQDQFGMAIIWITHDLGIVAGLTRRVNVMYAGRLIETGPVKEIYHNPRHPYTLGLLASLPVIHRQAGHKLFSIRGEPPNLVGMITGCPFAPRCIFAAERCQLEAPILRELESNHFVACWEKERVSRSQ